MSDFVQYIFSIIGDELALDPVAVRQLAERIQKEQKEVKIVDIYSLLGCMCLQLPSTNHETLAQKLGQQYGCLFIRERSYQLLPVDNMIQ